MTRLNLQMPEPTIFQTQLRVSIEHINYVNHMGHDSLVKLLHEARVQFFIAHGMREWDIDGSIILMVNLAIEYKQQAFYGDQLTIEIALGEPERKGCDLYYRVKRHTDNTVIAIAKTGIVFYDQVKQKVIDIPASFKRLYNT